VILQVWKQEAHDFIVCLEENIDMERRKFLKEKTTNN